MTEDRERTHYTIDTLPESTTDLENMLATIEGEIASIKTQIRYMLDIDDGVHDGDDYDIADYELTEDEEAWLKRAEFAKAKRAEVAAAIRVRLGLGGASRKLNAVLKFLRRDHPAIAAVADTIAQAVE